MQKNQVNPEQSLSPSKTRRKREMHALQDIGEQLVQLDVKRLAELGLPEMLTEAVLEAKRMRKHGAIRRQMQYIGKLMRNIDAAPITEKLQQWNGLALQHTAWLHLLERWRDRLMADEGAFGELGQEYPGADLSRIRALARDACQEKLANKPPKSFRALFQELQRIIPSSAKKAEDSMDSA